MQEKSIRRCIDLRRFNIGELAEIYGLPEETVEDELLDAISQSLTNFFGYEVDAVLDGSGVPEIYGYPDIHGEIEVRQIPISRINKQIVQRIKGHFTESLVRKRIFQEYSYLRNFSGSILEGTILKAVKGGPLFVKLHHDEPLLGSAGHIGCCPFRNQTPRERGTYRLGEVLAFHVLNVSPVVSDGVPRIDIVLSRNSRGLVEGLLLKQIHGEPRAPEMANKVKIKCVKRIAGAYSVIANGFSLPRHVVESVSNELKESIRVVRRG